MFRETSYAKAFGVLLITTLSKRTFTTKSNLVTSNPSKGESNLPIMQNEQSWGVPVTFKRKRTWSVLIILKYFSFSSSSFFIIIILCASIWLFFFCWGGVIQEKEHHKEHKEGESRWSNALEYASTNNWHSHTRNEFLYSHIKQRGVRN